MRPARREAPIIRVRGGGPVRAVRRDKRERRIKEPAAAELPRQIDWLPNRIGYRWQDKAGIRSGAAATCASESRIERLDYADGVACAKDVPAGRPDYRNDADGGANFQRA